MIPLSDENPTRTKPYIVYLLLLINILVFAYDRVTAQQVGPIMINGLWNFMLVPASLIQNQDVFVPYGPIKIQYVGLDPKWLTLFTSMFMHGSFMHIGGNMLYLWIFGNNIEDTLGHFKFLIFYLFCGLVAAFAHIIFNLNSYVPTVGASGAIAGVLGAYLILFPAARIKTLIFIGFFWTFLGVPAVILLGVWFFTQLINLGGSGGMQGGGVAYWAHVGGFVAGVVVIIILGGKGLLTSRKQYTRYNHKPYPWRPWK